MKILHKVSTLEVKRCFVVGKLCAMWIRRGNMRRVESTEHYVKRVNNISVRVLKFKEKALDKIIGGEYLKRLISYDGCQWYLAEVATSEVGVWTRAGELPLRWTNQSLKETADKVRRALNRKNGFKHKHIRAAHAVPGILKTSVSVIQDNKYLLPIVFKGNTALAAVGD